ncbi:hypothetical protein GCM10009837_32700 [Streptomyces durmitorensis]|uniref:Aromatic ring-opening dioxygenase LigA n=1 Tax=Streptomyces durmitorensis TaxID=319947 RepID=A0ABY4PZT3_9ACTN|nr:hypothetical protein [Streptomyces durmitorensis]UQT59326.1 hypothetical protein M4V62_32040 [Streptomyces durmitorensis]
MSQIRRTLRALAILSALPYLTLKIAWIAGSHIGIPEDSSLLEHRTTMIFANALTVLMDACVILLALLLTRPWGLRTPAWLLAFPMWAATGLLLPIMAGFPLQLLVKALGGSINRPSEDGGSGAFLDEWVFGVVYGGFILQGLALGALFVLYARDRWGHVWQGRFRDLPRPATTTRRSLQRGTAVAAALLALAPAALHLLWATGSTVGLNEARIEERTTDFYVLEALDLAYLAAAVAGGLLIAFRWAPALPVKVPLALAWLGSGAVTCWGGWLLFASLGGVDDIAEQPTPLMILTYAVRMIIGTLVVALGVCFFKERARTAARAPRLTA